MVHAGNHRFDGLAVAEAQHADLGTGQEFLHHNVVAGGAELFVQHDLLDAVGGFLLVLADQHTLAQRQTVRLDDNGVLALGADIVHDLGGIVKGFVFCRRDAVFFHQILAEHLAGLDAGGSLVGTESWDAHLRKLVHHAQCQRVVLSYHNVVKGFLLGKGDHGGYIGGGNGFALSVIADTAVAGGAPDLGAAGAFFQGADDGVFTSAAAHN